MPAAGQVSMRRGHPPPAGLARFLRADNGWTSLDLRRVLIITAWCDATAADNWEAKRRFPHATEHWRVRMRPVFVTGAIRGANPFGELRAARGSEHEPGLVLTWADVPPRFQPRFARDSFRSVNTQHAHPGLCASFVSAYLRLGAFRGFTVSCWRDLASMVDWAYRDVAHREAMAWMRSFPDDLHSRAWFGRFVVERSAGTLAGRDPFERLTDDDSPQALPGGGRTGSPLNLRCE
jgi:heme-degrading monooxygenase HmoA